MPLITNECKIVDQNEKESKLKDIKGKGNSAKKSTSFNTNQVADNNQVTLLEKESGKESNKKIVEERASQSIDSSGVFISLAFVLVREDVVPFCFS